MPNLVGQTLQSATQILQSAGMRLGTVKVTAAGATPDTTQASATTPPGAAPAPTSLILSQDPAAGQKIIAGSAVNFEVTR
jgi:beta-lactam-binding protein with PASTA domain